MRPLTISEQSNCTAELQTRILKGGTAFQNAITQEVEQAKIWLEKASTSDVDKFDPTLTEKIVGLMTAGEVLALYKAYNQKIDEIDPSLEKLGSDKVTELVAVLKKNPSALRELSPWQLQEILAFCLTKLDEQTDKSSIGP
jgi:hypothetical protein